MTKRTSNGHASHSALLDHPGADGTMRVDDQLEQEIQRLVEASRAGRLTDRGNAHNFTGYKRKVIDGVNEMLDAILLPIAEGNRVLAQISEGNIDELITETYQGDHEKMKLAVNNVAVVLQSLQREQARLTEASREGRLSERGRAEQFHGAYADIVKGLNEILDAILLPIGEGNRILTLVRGGKPQTTHMSRRSRDRTMRLPQPGQGWCKHLRKLDCGGAKAALSSWRISSWGFAIGLRREGDLGSGESQYLE